MKMIANFEQYRGVAYLDPVGVATIGYGFTTNVSISDKMHISEADERLSALVSDISLFIDQTVTVPLTNDQKIALISLVYNIGKESFINSNLLQAINSNNFELASDEIMRWVYAGCPSKCVKLPGLVVRRKSESRLFFGGINEMVGEI